MTLESFEIGVDHAGLANVEELGTPLTPPRSRFVEFSQDIELADGSTRGGGWPIAFWIWDFLTQSQYTQLLVFCAGKSDDVNIVTKTDHETFVEYTAVMVRPSEVARKDGKVFDVTVEFRSLVAV